MKPTMTTADLATLRQRYPHEPTARIAADMGRTVRTVYGAALHRLKSPAA